MRYLFAFIFLLNLNTGLAQSCEKKLDHLEMYGINPGNFDGDEDENGGQFCRFSLSGIRTGFSIGPFRIMNDKQRELVPGSFSFAGISVKGHVSIANVIFSNNFNSRNSDYGSFSFANSTVKSDIGFDSDTIQNSLAINAVAQFFYLENCVVGKLETPNGGNKLGHIYLTGTVLNSGGRFYSEGVEVIDLTGARILGPQKLELDLVPLAVKGVEQKILIGLANTDVEKIEFDYAHFTLDTSELSEPRIKTIYEALLNKFKAANDDKNYSLVDREYLNWKYHQQHLEPILIDILWFWEDYLIHPSRAMNFLLSFLLLATGINFFIYRKLNTDVYTLSNFPPYADSTNRFKQFYYNVYNSFIYTVVVFLSLNVKFERLFFNRKILLLWFFVIYLSGYWFLYLVLKQLKLS